jgi:hypothetical protein
MTRKGICRIAEILVFQVVIQDSGSFGRNLGNVKATYLNVPNALSFQMFMLVFCRLKQGRIPRPYTHHRQSKASELYEIISSAHERLCAKNLAHK